MKILRIIARLNVGGPARHVVWLTEALNDTEFESLLIAGTVPPGEEDMGYLAAERGVEPVYVKEMSRELSPKDIVSLAKIYRGMRLYRPDVVHTHTAKAGTVGRTAAFLYRWLTPGTLIGRPRRVRIVHTFHGHVFHSYYGRAKTRLFLFIERMLARVTDRIVVISRRQMEEISREFAVSRATRFAVIPLGIDLEPFTDSASARAAFRSEIGASESDIVVGFIGRLTEIKNIQMLLAAAAAVRKSSDAAAGRLRFVIAGDGHLRAGLEETAAELGVEGLVSFIGNRTDIPAVYAGMDIVALTSLNEGTPLSLIEAMAAGRPYISTRVGGVADLLGESVETYGRFTLYERGLGTEPNETGGFAEGLIYLAKNERLRNELGTLGRNHVQRNYSKDRLIDDIKNLYRELAV